MLSTLQVVDKYPMRVHELLSEASNRPFTQAEIELIRDEYANGYGPAAIAAKIKQELNIDRDPSAVPYRIKLLIKNDPTLEKQHDANLKGRKSPTLATTAEIELIRDEYANGYGPAAIAAKIKQELNIDRDTSVIFDKIQQLINDDPTLEKQHDANLKGPRSPITFTDEEIALIRDEYANGYGPAAIAAKIKQELGIDRATGAVTSKIQQQPDYKTVLLNLHLENLQKLSGTSHQEIEFFTELGKYNSLPRCERNVRIPGTRYNADGLDPASKTIVEYFGTLWHADPKKYHNEDQWLGRLSCTVGDIHAKDAIKLKRLQGLGYTVVVVWEREWTKRDTRQQCLDRVRAALV